MRKALEELNGNEKEEKARKNDRMNYEENLNPFINNEILGPYLTLKNSFFLKRINSKIPSAPKLLQDIILKIKKNKFNLNM